ncbi:MAG: carbohydrate kinase [Rikenellaceae bacterium]
METKGIIVGVGEALWDLLPDGKQIGGAPANFAFHASHMGFEGWAVSAVGADSLGDEIITTLNSKGVKTLIQRTSQPTGTVQVTLSGEGIPHYEICQGVAWDNINYTPEVEALAQKALCVVFGSLAQRNEPSRSTIHNFVECIAQRSGTMRIFDINLRQKYYNREMIAESLRLCNILKINDEELVVFCSLFSMESGTLEERCRKIIEDYSLDMLILTCGDTESYIFHQGGTSRIPTPKVEVADTVGAGDSFTATFATSMLRGESVEKAHALAVKVAAYVCTQKGAMPETQEAIID